MAIRELKPKHIFPLTREAATNIANMRSCKGDRDTKQARLKFLEEQKDKGEFYSPTWAVAKMGTQLFRVNGKHSSTMLSSTSEFPTDLGATILMFECDSEEDVGNLYSKFDTKQSARSDQDMIQALKAGKGDRFISVSNTNMRVILDGIAYADGAEDTSYDISSTKSRYMNLHADYINWANKYAGSRKFKRSPVMGAKCSKRT